MKKIIDSFRQIRITQWILIAAAIFGVGLLVDGMAGGYIWRTVGGAAKCIVGGLIGWWFSRRTARLNLSQITDSHDRCIAGLSQSVLIAAGMLGVALSV